MAEARALGGFQEPRLVTGAAAAGDNRGVQREFVQETL